MNRFEVLGIRGAVRSLEPDIAATPSLEGLHDRGICAL